MYKPKGYTKADYQVATWYWKDNPGWSTKSWTVSKKPIVVILQCSNKKLSSKQIKSLKFPKGSAAEIVAKTEGKATAFTVYDGPLWKTFRKFCMYGGRMEDNPFRFLVMSAKYGLIPIETFISNYDKLLGRDVKPQNLEKLIKTQVKKYKLNKKEVYAFTSRSYSDVLANAGVSFCYVKGGIGTKRNRLKKLWVKQKLPKTQVELYE